MMKLYEGVEFVSEFKKNPCNFFKGKEGFLVVDRDWGDHSHHRSIKYLLTYIERGVLSLQDLEEGVHIFICSLDKDCEDDLFQLTANACYIYCSIYEDNFYQYRLKDDFFLPGHACHNEAKRYIESVRFNYSDQHYVSLIKKEYPQSGLANILR